MHLAAKDNNVSVLWFFQFNYEMSLDGINKKGNSPLHIAAKQNFDVGSFNYLT